jgi:hypothetical protein
MGSIRVGYFEDFKGADTLLIDVDHEGLRSLISWVRELPLTGRKATLSDCPGARLQSRLRVDVLLLAGDIGLVRTERPEVRLATLRGWLDGNRRKAGRNGRCRLPSVSRWSTGRR